MYQEHCETRRTKKPNKEERKELTHGLSLFELRRGLLEKKEYVFFAIHRGRKMKKHVGGERRREKGGAAPPCRRAVAVAGFRGRGRRRRRRERKGRWVLVRMMKGRRKRRWICEGGRRRRRPFCRRKSQGGGEEEEEGSRVREKGRALVARVGEGEGGDYIYVI